MKAVLTGTASPLRGTVANGAGAGRLQLAAALAADPGPAHWQTPVATADDKPLGDPAAWTGSSWTGSSWTGSSWTGSSWTSAFWGDHPKPGRSLPGE